VEKRSIRSTLLSGFLYFGTLCIWPTLPALGDCEAGEFGGIKIGRGNWSTR
jgi:hypothetical protein